MGLAHQLNTEPGVKRLYSVALEVWDRRKKKWLAKIDTCHAWTADDAAQKIRASYPRQFVKIVAAGVTLGFFVKDSHGEELEV